MPLDSVIKTIDELSSTQIRDFSTQNVQLQISFMTTFMVVTLLKCTQTTIL